MIWSTILAIGTNEDASSYHHGSPLDQFFDLMYGNITSRQTSRNLKYCYGIAAVCDGQFDHQSVRLISCHLSICRSSCKECYLNVFIISAMNVTIDVLFVWKKKKDRHSHLVHFDMSYFCSFTYLIFFFFYGRHNSDSCNDMYALSSNVHVAVSDAH